MNVTVEMDESTIPRITTRLNGKITTTLNFDGIEEGTLIKTAKRLGAWTYYAGGSAEDTFFSRILAFDEYLEKREKDTRKILILQAKRRLKAVVDNNTETELVNLIDALEIKPDKKRRRFEIEEEEETE